MLDADSTFSDAHRVILHFCFITLLYANNNAHPCRILSYIKGAVDAVRAVLKDPEARTMGKLLLLLSPLLLVAALNVLAIKGDQVTWQYWSF